MASEADKTWDRAWSAQDMVDNASNWNLAADEGLLKHLEAFSENLFANIDKSNDNLNSLLKNLDDVSIKLDLTKNEFLSLHNTQFIESRVYEDDETLFAEKKEEVGVKKPTQEDQNNLIKKLVSEGLDMLDKYYDKVSVPASDSEDETDGVSFVLQPKDLYAHRPLPYLIGSEEWHKKWHVGLAESSDEFSDEEKVSEKFSDTDSESNLPITDRRGISYSDSSTNISNRVIAHSTFNDSSDGEDLDNSIPIKAPISNENFAEQLAVKLGTVIDEPEFNKRPIQKGPTQIIGDLFSDTPPPLDDFEEHNFVPKSDGMFSGGGGLFDDSGDEIEPLWGAKPIEKNTKKVDIKTKLPNLFDDDIEEDLFVPKINENAKKVINSDLFDEDSDSDIFAPINKNAKKSILKPFSNIPTFVDDEPPEIEAPKKKPFGGVSHFGDNPEIFAQPKLANLLPKRQASSSSSGSEISEKEDPRKKPKSSVQNTKKANIFDDDDLFAASENNLFGATKTPQKPSLFDDEPNFINSLENEPKRIGLFDDEPTIIEAMENKAKKASLFDDEPKNIKSLENKPKQASLFDDGPKIIKAMENKPKKASLFDNEPKTIEAMENKAKKASLFDDDPKTIKAMENKPKKASLFDDEPKIIKAMENKSKKTSLFDDEPKINKSLENKPKKIGLFDDSDDIFDNIFSNHANNKFTSNLFDDVSKENNSSLFNEDEDLFIGKSKPIKENKASLVNSETKRNKPTLDENNSALFNEDEDLFIGKSKPIKENKASLVNSETKRNKPTLDKNNSALFNEDEDLFIGKSKPIKENKEILINSEANRNKPTLDENKLLLGAGDANPKILKNTENIASKLFEDPLSDEDIFAPKNATKIDEEDALSPEITKEIMAAFKALDEGKLPQSKRIIAAKPQIIPRKGIKPLEDINPIDLPPKYDEISARTMPNQQECINTDLFVETHDAIIEPPRITKSIPNLFDNVPPPDDDWDSRSETNLFEDDDLFEGINVSAKKASIFDDEPPEIEPILKIKADNNLIDDSAIVTDSEVFSIDKIPDDNIFDKLNDAPLKSGLVKKQLEKSMDIQSEIEAPVKETSPTKIVPGKLKHNLNINVAALMPGMGMPRKKDVSLIKTQSLDNETCDNPDEIKASVSCKDMTDHDVKVNQVETLHSVTKSRAKISIKRRPSTRKARQESIRKSMIENTLDNDNALNNNQIDTEISEINQNSAQIATKINEIQSETIDVIEKSSPESFRPLFTDEIISKVQIDSQQSCINANIFEDTKEISLSDKATNLIESDEKIVEFTNVSKHIKTTPESIEKNVISEQINAIGVIENNAKSIQILPNVSKLVLNEPGFKNESKQVIAINEHASIIADDSKHITEDFKHVAETQKELEHVLNEPKQVLSDSKQVLSESELFKDTKHITADLKHAEETQQEPQHDLIKSTHVSSESELFKGTKHVIGELKHAEDTKNEPQFDLNKSKQVLSESELFKGTKHGLGDLKHAEETRKEPQLDLNKSKQVLSESELFKGTKHVTADLKHAEKTIQEPQHDTNKSKQVLSESELFKGAKHVTGDIKHAEETIQEPQHDLIKSKHVLSESKHVLSESELFKGTKHVTVDLKHAEKTIQELQHDTNKSKHVLSESKHVLSESELFKGRKLVTGDLKHAEETQQEHQHDLTKSKHILSDSKQILSESDLFKGTKHLLNKAEDANNLFGANKSTESKHISNIFDDDNDDSDSDIFANLAPKKVLKSSDLLNKSSGDDLFGGASSDLFESDIFSEAVISKSVSKVATKVVIDNVVKTTKSMDSLFGATKRSIFDDDQLFNKAKPSNKLIDAKDSVKSSIFDDDEDDGGDLFANISKKMPNKVKKGSLFEDVDDSDDMFASSSQKNLKTTSKISERKFEKSKTSLRKSEDKEFMDDPLDVLRK